MKRGVSSRFGGVLSALLALLGMQAPGAMAQANVKGRWSTISNFTMPINPIHTVLLHNGKLLIVAGSGNCPPNQSGCPSGAPYGPSNHSGAALIDPLARTVTQFTVAWDMFCNAMIVLPDGRALIAGGTLQYDPFHGQPKATVFDPSTNSFTDVQSMAHGRWYPTLTTLGDGRVMVFSGSNEMTGATNTAVEFYTAGLGWSQQFTAPWTPPLYPRMHLLPNGKVFYSGAGTSSNLFDPSTATWTLNVAATNYSGARSYGSSVLLPLTPANNYDPKVMILGGNNPATNTTEIIDLGAATPHWVLGPNMSQARIELNAVILPNGKVLAVGGSTNDEDTSTLSLNADLYDPASNTFSSAGANASERLYHSVALLLPDATVWVAGGNPLRGTYNNTMEIYSPAYLFNSAGALATRPSISSAPTSILFGNKFTVQSPNAASIAGGSVVLVRPGAPTHSFNMDQRLVRMSFTVGSGFLTVTAPPNGNIAPPGYYMLFILNSSGVPSVAKFVQLVAPSNFSVAAAPSSGSVPQGNPANYSVTVTASGGFNGNVTFSVSGLPSGAIATFSPNSLTGSGSATMTVSTSPSTPIGSYTLTIRAASGSSLSHTANVTLAVSAPSDFSISVSTPSQTVSGNSRPTYPMTVAAHGSFSGTVTFSVSGLPDRTSASFSPASVVTSGTTNMTLFVKKKAPTGSYTLAIRATSGSLSHSTTVTLGIQ